MRAWLLLLVALLLLGCGRGGAQVQVVNAFPSLTFSSPLFLTHAGDGTNRVFVVEQGGAIKVFPNDSLATSSKVFLNIHDRLSSSGGEEGLLGLAFHPQYASNGYFYVDYTAPSPLRTVISRFRVSASDPSKADSLSEYKILEIAQPYSNHNGGMVVFGADGYLYIGMGDGGSGGDPLGNGQNRGVLLGKILRIDVNDTTASTRYRIPPDNPYAGNSQGFREEIWAYGLRNPWRFSFDPPTGELWCGDVGQNRLEEVDLITRGGNYGWNIMEGFSCYSPSTGCNQTGLILPVKEYSHSLGCSITGGYVYRGPRVPWLNGAYIYGDYCTRTIWMLRRSGGILVADSLLASSPSTISSFGVDQEGELYVTGHGDGKIYRFINSSMTDTGDGPHSSIPTGFSLSRGFPNPFNPTTRWELGLPTAAIVSMVIFDILGRAVIEQGQQILAAGVHTLELEGSGLSSGSYLCRVTAVPLNGSNAYAVTRRAILLR